MEISDSEGALRVKVSGFKKYSDNYPIFINTQVEVFLDNGSFKESIDFELLDFELLLDNLKEIKKTLKKVFCFGDIDELFNMTFIPINNGNNILIKSVIKDKMHINELSFSFEIVPIEIEFLIEKVEKNIKHFLS